MSSDSERCVCATTQSSFIHTRTRESDLPAVEADLSLGQFMDDVAWSQRYTTYPVLGHGRPIGLLAFRSVASVPRTEWNTRRVRDAMIPARESRCSTRTSRQSMRSPSSLRAM
jgi:hypothetical protein